MDKNLQNIEDLFKKGLEENEEVPSPEVWNRIDNHLDKEDTIKIKKKYRSLKNAAFLLIFLLVGLTTYIWINNSGKEIKSSLKNESAVKNNQGIENEKTKTDNINSKKLSKNVIEEIKSKRDSLSGSVVSKQANTGNKSKVSNSSFLSNLLQQRNNTIKNVVQKNTGQQKDKIALILNQFPLLQQVLGSDYFIKNHKNRDLKNIQKISPFISFSGKNSKIDGSKILQKPTFRTTVQSNFFATIFFSPDIPFSQLRDEDNRYGNIISRELEKSESASFSSTFGIYIDYEVTDKWSLQSGIKYATININKEPEIIYAEHNNAGEVKYQINTSVGKGYILPLFSNNPNVGDSLFTKSTTHSLQYIEIPITAEYYITKGKVSVSLMAGLSANILMCGKITTEVKNGNESEWEKTNEIQGLKPIYFSGITGIGLDYKIYKNLSLHFSPKISVGLNPINNESIVKSFPRTISFEIGLKRRL